MLRLLLLLQEHGEAAGQAAHDGGGAAHGPTPFDINTGVIFWTLIIFGVLLAMLWKWAYPSIVRSVEERERRIQQQLDEAEKNRVESARLLEEHKKLIAGARTEAQDLIVRAKQVADKEREALLQRARHEQDEMLARARREIQEEKQKAVLALRAEAVDLALAAASRLVDQKLDGDANRRLVTDYLAGIDRSS